MSSLYILEIRPLSEVSLANMFSHTLGSLFILMLFSLAMQKLFNLTVTRGEVGGDNGGKGWKGFQEQL